MIGLNEKIYVGDVFCDTAEYDYEKGEIPGRGCFWTGRDIPIDRAVGYDTVGEALAAVCKANGFSYKKENWLCRGVESGDAEEYSEFSASTLICDDGTEASELDVEKWKAGKEHLRICNVIAVLEVRSASRPLTEDEAKNWS